MKSIEQLVVTASSTGPIRLINERYTATSARENIAGPDTVPPGRRFRSVTYRRRRIPSS